MLRWFAIAVSEMLEELGIILTPAVDPLLGLGRWSITQFWLKMITNTQEQMYWLTRPGVLDRYVVKDDAECRDNQDLVDGLDPPPAADAV